MSCVVQVKVGSTIEVELEYRAELTLEELRTKVEYECGVERSKQQLIYKGRKLQGVAFPDGLTFAELEPKPPAKMLLMLLGGVDLKVRKTLDDVEKALGPSPPEGVVLDALTLTEFSEKLDSLGCIGKQRERRRKLLEDIALREKKS